MNVGVGCGVGRGCGTDCVAASVSVVLNAWHVGSHQRLMLLCIVYWLTELSLNVFNIYSLCFADWTALKLSFKMLSVLSVKV